MKEKKPLTARLAIRGGFRGLIVEDLVSMPDAGYVSCTSAPSVSPSSAGSAT